MIIALVVVNSVLALGTVVVLLYTVLRLAAYLNPGAYRKVINTDRLPSLKSGSVTDKIIDEALGSGDKPPFKSALNDFIKQ